jgi:hypothetical protein
VYFVWISAACQVNPLIKSTNKSCWTSASTHCCQFLVTNSYSFLHWNWFFMSIFGTKSSPNGICTWPMACHECWNCWGTSTLAKLSAQVVFSW